VQVIWRWHYFLEKLRKSIVSMGDRLGKGAMANLEPWVVSEELYCIKALTSLGFVEQFSS
jgi:hypothetical protein